MKFYLLKMNVFGVKNIDKEVELKFSNQQIKSGADLRKYNVKAIYGANGAGKTALIYGAEIYRKFVLDRDYLPVHNSNFSLFNLINQNKKEMSVKMTFAVLDDADNLKNIYAHTISFQFVNGRYQVKKELLLKLHGKRINEESKYQQIYCVENGAISTEQKELVEMCANVVVDRSVVSHLFEYSLNNINKLVFEDIFNVGLFARSLTVMIYTCDTNYIDLNHITRQIQTITKYQNQMDESTFAQLMVKQCLLDSDETIVDKKNYEKFIKNVKNMCSFLKVFKPNLKNIKIKKDEKGSQYICNLVFEYENGLKIARQYESAGIKKLMSIYYALCNVERGGIVFIDELDANIHDVVLLRLVEYIREYTNGQLIFTTHNLAPMEVLQKDKFSIDFLSSDSEITSWIASGNSSAARLYRKGLIKYSPFNIEAFSFLGVFGDE